MKKFLGDMVTFALFNLVLFVKVLCSFISAIELGIISGATVYSFV